MPVPGFLSSALRVTGGTVGKAAGYGIVGALEVGNFRREVREGSNPFLAAGKGVLGFATMTMLGAPAQIAVQFGIPLGMWAGRGMVRNIQDYNRTTRLARTPFSHRFEHTDVTARAQMMGLQQIGQAWSFAQMGSEASMFARRYGR